MKNDTKGNIKQKKAQSEGDRWDLEPILGKKKFDDLVLELNAKVESFKRYRSILDDKINAKKVLEILQLEESLGVDAGNLETYYSLKFYADTKNQEALAKLGQLKQIMTEINNETLFFSLWFMHLDDATAKKILENAEIKPYRYHLELIRKSKPYTKSEEIEKIINIKDITGAEGFAELYEIITSNYVFDWDGKKMPREEVTAKYRSSDPKERQKAYELTLTRYKEESTALSEIYKNVVMDWVNDGVKIRGHKSSISVRNKSYDVTDRSVETLLKVIRKNVRIFSEYFRLKYELNRKAGQKYPFSRYHLYAPFITKTSTVYPYEKCKSIMLDTYKRFDERFYERAKRILDDRHVDSHPAESKRGGAFCYDMPKGSSPYILLNHADTLRDLSTMMHEFGHGIHDLFASERQTNIEKHASLTICETASVFGEMILMERMLAESKDPEEKKRLIVESLDNHWATIIRQAYFVIFEKYAHEAILRGETKERLDEEYYSLLKEQFGDMEIPDLFKHEWNYIPHIHETPFYCYSYAWGNLFVLALYDMYRKEGKPFIEKYIDLLSAGGSDSPGNLMKRLGADPESEEFWQRGFEQIRSMIDGLKALDKKV